MKAPQRVSAPAIGAVGGEHRLAQLRFLLDHRPQPCPDFLVRDALVPALTATTKEGVIREMVEALCAAGEVLGADAEDVVRAVLRRERLGTTGIGGGVAFPHAKHTSVQRVLGNLAVSPCGVDFASLDHEPAHVFALVISPVGQSGPHLRALEALSRYLRDDHFVRALRAGAVAAELAVGSAHDAS
jgi:mannitol/fructose-specific phosphotransferase system IIA component (Ntr-type)